MASVFFRGPKAAPRWYARWRDTAGVWRARRVRVETRGDAVKIARQLEAQAERRRYGLEAPESAGLVMGELLRRWESGLTNRSAYDDRSRLRKWVVPKWGGARLADVTLPAVMVWLDELKAARQVAPGTQRHLLAILSRFFSWAVERGFAQANPCRMIPPGKRPQHAPKKNVPWLADDALVRRIFAALPEPVNLMFFVGLTSGCRLMEIAGLRLSDVDELAAGTIRVRYSGAGPLKEDRRGVGKVKFVPAPADAQAVLGPWLEHRRAAGAGPEDFVFVKPDGYMIRKDWIAYRWARVADDLGLALGWHEATRHSFVSRALARGASLDEVSTACGHATPAITAARYSHFVRKTWSPLVAAGLGLGGGSPANVVAIGAARAPVSPGSSTAAAAAPVPRPTDSVGTEYLGEPTRNVG
jgi:integrase